MLICFNSMLLKVCSYVIKSMFIYVSKYVVIVCYQSMLSKACYQKHVKRSKSKHVIKVCFNSIFQLIPIEFRITWRSRILIIIIIVIIVSALRNTTAPRERSSFFVITTIIVYQLTKFPPKTCSIA